MVSLGLGSAAPCDAGLPLNRPGRLIAIALKRKTGGPVGPPVMQQLRMRLYQVPPEGQAPLLVVAHVREVTPVVPFLVIVNVLPDAELPTIV